MLESSAVPNDNADAAGLSGGSYTPCGGVSSIALGASPDCLSINTPDRCYDVENN